MNPRNTWLLIVLAAAMFGYIFLFERHATGPVAVTNIVLPGLKQSDVTSLQIQTKGQIGVRLEKTNDAWRLTEPFDYPAQSLVIDRLLEALARLAAHTHISARELKDRPKADEDFGFDTPQISLTLFESGHTRQVKFGNMTAPGDEVYIQVVGMDGVEIVGSDLLKIIPRVANDVRDTAFAKFPAESVTSIKRGENLEIVREGTNRVWRMSKPMQARVDNQKINELLFNLQNLHVARFETDDPKADLEPFGLLQPEIELTLSQGTNQILGLQFGRSPTNMDAFVYAKRAGQSTVVLVPRASIEAWRGQSIDFRDRHLVRFSSGLPDVIEVQGEQPFAVEKQTNDAWRVQAPNDYPADPELMKGFLKSLVDLEIVPVPVQFSVKDVVTEADFPKYGLTSPSSRYIMKRTVPLASGGTTNEIVAQLDFGSLTDSKDRIYVRRADALAGEGSVYVVKVDDFKKLPSQPMQLRDRRIWKFDENDVKAIELHINGKKTQYIRRAQAEWSIAPGSSGVVTGVMMEFATQELSDFSAQSWLARGVTEKPRFGFNENSPLVIVALIIDGKPQTVSVEFGGPEPGKITCGCVTLEGQAWIFEFPPKVLERLIYCLNLR